MGLPAGEQMRFATLFAGMPLLAEIDTEYGLVAMVHADCPLPSWDDLRHAISHSDLSMRLRDRLKMICQWSRERIYSGDERGVEGVRALVVGHTPVRDPTV